MYGTHRQPPQIGSLSAAAQDISKFFPKVDLQADYTTAKVRGGPGGRWPGRVTQGVGVGVLTLPPVYFRVYWVLATRPCGWLGPCWPGRR